jgi:hypothetical protein
MLKSADQIENNPLRPELKDYIEKGLLLQNKGSVSTTQEYNASDYAISLWRKPYRIKKDYERLRIVRYRTRKLYDKI